MSASLSASTDARAHRRLALELEVTLQSDSNFYIGLTENLSDGGIFVAMVAVAVTYMFLYWSGSGFQTRLVGEGERAAHGQSPPGAAVATAFSTSVP